MTAMTRLLGIAVPTLCLLACGGSGGPTQAQETNVEQPRTTSDAGARSTRPTTRTPETPVIVDAGAQSDASDAAPPKNSNLPQKPNAVPAATSQGRPAGVICSNAYVGLDMGSLDVKTAGPFAQAWKSERAASVAPGLVLRLEGLDVGSPLATLGPVHALSPVSWGFETPPLTARSLLVNPETNKRVIAIPAAQRTAVVSFGNGSIRRGFALKLAQVDGILNSACEAFQGKLRAVIPTSSGPQPFGGSTIAALLGDTNVDIEGDGIRDGWLVEWQGKAGIVLVEAP